MTKPAYQAPVLGAKFGVCSSAEWTVLPFRKAWVVLKFTASAESARRSRVGVLDAGDMDVRGLVARVEHDAAGACPRG